MPYNVFKKTQTEQEALIEHYPSLTSLYVGGKRISNNLLLWDATAISLIQRITFCEWRVLDKSYGLLRDTLGVEGRIFIQQFRQNYRDLWISSTRHVVDKRAKKSLTLVQGGAEALDQIEADIRSNATLNVDMWLNQGRKLIVCLREG